MNMMWRILLGVGCVIAVRASSAKAPAADIVGIARTGTSIVVEDLSPIVTETLISADGSARQLPPKIREVRVEAPADVSRFVKLFSITQDRLRRGVEVTLLPSGKKQIIYPPCQCLGDFRVRIIREGKELLSFTTYHAGEYIQIGPKESGDEYDLVQPTGAELHRFLAAILEGTNQSVETTRGTQP